MKYFPNLSEEQKERFTALFPLYQDWNAKINVISRKDIDNLYLHHVLHSLAIAKVITFKAGTTLVDVGTGGGFPGIPLAIMFPECEFLMVDSIGKKVRVAQEVAEAIGLTNCRFLHSRMEDVKEQFAFIVSRAVMPLSDLVELTRKNVHHKHQNGLPNGLICLKGGALEEEIKKYKNKATLYELSKWYEGEFFQTKKCVYLPL